MRAFVVLLGLLSAALLIAPLLGKEPGREDAEAGELPSVRERESIYSAIRDLEHDHETGKIAEADYASMRDELRGRALALLRREREAAAERKRVPRCPACEADVGAADRFCSRCGQALAAGAQSEATR